MNRRFALKTVAAIGALTLAAACGPMKLPAGTVENLLKPENKDQLVSILTYHVVPGRVTSAQLAGKRVSVKTVQGSSVNIDGRNGVKVDGATVVVADVVASNGIIHVIDSVILP